MKYKDAPLTAPHNGGRIGVTSMLPAFLLFFAARNISHATVYFSYDAENATVGSALTNPPFCQTACTGAGASGTHQSADETPQGSRYFQWQTIDNQHDHYTVIGSTGQLPAPSIIGKIIYLALFFNFTRIVGLDIWHEVDQSADKALEYNGSGVRWEFSLGQWDSTCYASNQNHRYTAWVGNPTYHLNPTLECIGQLTQNASGYSGSNPIQLDYGVWHSAVLTVKVAADNTGFVQLHVNGIKTTEYLNIKTAGSATATIDNIRMGGTIAQPAYDAPAHIRKFDALLLTDNWQDVVAGGYLSPGTVSATAPAAPRGLQIR